MRDAESRGVPKFITSLHPESGFQAFPPSPAPQPVQRHLPQSPGEVLRAEGQEGPLTASGGGQAGGVEGGATLPATRAVGGTLP